jgi:predicted ArsR family transcriptional regulator
MLSNDDTLDITSALSDPTRYGIYRSIIEAAGDPLTVAEVAESFSLHPNVARMHLQKLVDVGLVQMDTRKSQGGGRPARIYRLSDRVADLQFPPRDYRMLATLALKALETLAGEHPEVLERIGYDMGREEGRKALRRGSMDPRDRDLATVLDSLRDTCSRLGLYPRLEVEDGWVKIEVRNCVFRELSTEYPDMVCLLHTATLRGILEAFLEELEIEAAPAICTGEKACVFSIRLAS